MKWYTANALAAFEDFGVGALIAGVLTIAYGTETSMWFLGLGGVLALLPDFDIIIPILSRKTVVGNHHLTLMHRPLLLVPLATTLAWILGGLLLATTTFLCILWHYIHDSPECGGGGIAWLWPFSDTMLSLRGKEIVTKECSAGEHMHYLQQWCQPCIFSVREITVGSLGVASATLIATPSMWWIGTLIVLAAWVSYLSLWASTYWNRRHRSAS